MDSTSASTSTSSDGPLFLGLDLSTQALKASLLSDSLVLLSELSINFDSSLPHYGTKGGVLLGPEGSGEVFSPVLMAVEAFDRLAEKMIEAQWPVERVRCVSAAGQQHASVYWSRAAPELLKDVEKERPLVEQLKGAFSRSTIPNWQDSSTTVECGEFETRVGGADALAALTGSRAYERFTGPQILRFRKLSPEAYQDTERISLVSSFVTTMLSVGGEEAEIKGIDESDACGMNLWDLGQTAATETRDWAKPLLQLISGSEDPTLAHLGGEAELYRKLGRVESDGGRIVGRIGKWWQQRLGFSADCLVCPATGDNNATLLSFVLGPKEALVSLGTSDTLLIPTPIWKPAQAYHVFYHPARVAGPNATEMESDRVDAATVTTAAKHVNGNGNTSASQAAYFNMLVYKNGSLARQSIRDDYCSAQWDIFDQAVQDSWPFAGTIDNGSSSNGNASGWAPLRTGFYWLKPDIIPSGAVGVHLYENQGDDGRGHSFQKVKDFKQSDAATSPHPGAIVSSQLLSFRSRVGTILGVDSSASRTSSLSRIHASGGASSNLTLLQTMADILGCDLVKPSTDSSGNACSIGAAYRARWAWERENVKGREGVSFDECIKSARGGSGGEEGGGEGGFKVLASPNVKRHEAWEAFLPVWKELEERALREAKGL